MLRRYRHKKGCRSGHLGRSYLPATCSGCALCRWHGRGIIRRISQATDCRQNRLEPSDPVRALAGFAIGNTLETMSQHAADSAKDFARTLKRHATDKVNVTHTSLIEMEFVELPVFGNNPAYSTGN